MPRIRQLPPNVIAKIQAGEVIERPASVVKELVENAVDAEATRIEVELEEGGADFIRVVDDGHGIEADQLRLALASHATSKLIDADDLFRVGTLGFRGEALASIAGVAQMRVQSRARNCNLGAEVECEGGVLSDVRSWNGSVGTRVDVRNLFFNTPVRRKFLKSATTEVGHVAEALTRLALSRPGLHLVLRHNGKVSFEVPASATLIDRICLFFGAEVAKALYPLEPKTGALRLSGYICDPSCDRGTPKLQYFFVNGRWFRDRSLGHALQEGYRGLLLTGRYAAAFLYVDLPADQVDVNVHPTKAEVRFRESNAVYHLVLASVKERLRIANLTPRLQVPAPSAGGGNEEALLGHHLPDPPVIAVKDRGGLLGLNGFAGTPGDPSASPASDRLDENAAPLVERAISSPALSKAFQLHDAYLVVESEGGMLVIDQHALHERILFEQLRRRIAMGSLESQRLLIPEPMEFTAEQAAKILEVKDELILLGLDIQDFGNGTILVMAVPAILDRVAPADLFQDVADRLIAKDRPPNKEQLLEHLLATMACRAAVKAGDHLTPEEIADLIAQRELAENSHHCPHGRPTSLLLSRRDLDRQFRRI